MDVEIYSLPRPLVWRFPARSTHDGIPLGNGLFGALIWGEGHQLRITINRADYWDHRGGVAFGPEATYANLRCWLEAQDEESLRRVFEGRGTGNPGDPPRPTRLPMGRVDLDLSPNGRITGADLDLAAGRAVLQLEGEAPTLIEALIPRGKALLALRIQGYAAHAVVAHSRPPDAPEVLEYWRTYGLSAPDVTDPDANHDLILNGPAEGSWVQELPVDPELCVAWLLTEGEGGAVELYIAAEFGEDADEARERARAEVNRAYEQGYTSLAANEAAWWRAYWVQSARVQVPDVNLQEIYALGMYKLAGMSLPGTPAATLQGPWVEEYRMPPWSSDYHFNINVQECYWPAFGGNQLPCLEPLWKMLKAWEPKLRENARAFLGLEDGLMLNHAVDDHGIGMGGFWTGAIDHGSTAWVAQMMWQYYLYSLDEGFLAHTAYPFMVGAMRVYETMLEQAPDGTYALPISVSPEYGGSAMWAWGRNASFQLAIIHFLCRALVHAATLLGCDSEAVARWRRIDAGLPIGSLAGDGAQRELQLWDGQPLAQSHRHHSHLAALYPFDVLDPWGSEEDRLLLRNSLRTWTFKGMGEWSGWCVPWAAVLQARMHNAERAALLLEEYRRAFTTAGRSSTHDAVLSGLTVIDRRPDIMQMDASMGATAAVLEMLVHTASGVLRVFPAVPQAWDDVCFAGVRTEGAFLVSAERRHGETAWVRILSTHKSILRLATPFGDRMLSMLSNRTPGETIFSYREVLEYDTDAGEELYFTPSSI